MKRYIRSTEESKGYNYRGFYIHETSFGYDVWERGKRVSDELSTKDEAEAFVDEVMKEE